MGSIYYQQEKNLDSLSDVSGFSSALNGKTYGLKKIGGRFYPDDVNGGGSISGIVPNSGLYLDGSNRVGVSLAPNSGLSTNSSGLSVNIGDNLALGTNGIMVKKGPGFANNNTSLTIGTGLGIIVNANDVSVKIDNNTITTNSSGQLKANFPAAPVLPIFQNIFDVSVNNINMNTINLTNCATRITSIPPNTGLLITTTFEITFEADASIDYDTCRIIIDFLGLTTDGIDYVDYLVDQWSHKQIKDLGGIFSGTFNKKLSYTGTAVNKNTFTVDATLQLGCSTIFGSTDGFPVSLTATNFKTQVISFPVSP